jgi:hypothetical protein
MVHPPLFFLHILVLFSSTKPNLTRIPPSVFTGKDASRALALTSTKVEDVRPEWADLDEKEKKTLDDWLTYFSKRYNIVGVVEGATNMEG